MHGAALKSMSAMPMPATSFLTPYCAIGRSHLEQSVPTRLYGVSKSNGPLAARAVAAAAASGVFDETAPATAVSPAFFRNALRFRPMICAMLPPELRRCYTSLTRFHEEFRTHIVCVPPSSDSGGCMSVLAIALTTWTMFAKPDAGFAVEVPGPRIGDATPTHFAFALDDSAFSVDLQPLPETIQQAILRGDRALVTKALEGGRNAMVAELKGTPGTFSADDFEGLPSMVYSFTGTLGQRPFVARTRIVFVNSQIVIASALG